jgi:G:T-mismatch repair DNA endonuclease (very short patch repair protein)
MADVFDKEVRSTVMSKVRSKGNKTTPMNSVMTKHKPVFIGNIF